MYYRRKGKSIIAKIKENITIPIYCDYSKYEYRRDGNWKGKDSYRLVKHDSLVFTDREFYWNRERIGGSIIDFVMAVEKLSFDDAFNKLKFINPKGITNSSFIEEDNDNKTQFVYGNENLRNVLAYLDQTRGIDGKSIRELISKGLLTSDNKRNACFVIKNYTTGKDAGYEVHGTNPKKRFKHISKGVEYGMGFNIKIGEPKKAIFFETAIDLLSFKEIFHYEMKDVILISLGGLKINVVNQAINDLNLREVIFAVDNDIAGENLIKEARERFGDSINIKAKTTRSKITKDWNAVLMARKNIERIDYEEEEESEKRCSLI